MAPRTSRRVVRKQPLATRLLSMPFDLWLSVSDSIEIFDWDAKAVPIALPLGGICDFLLVLCRAYASFSEASTSSVGKSNELFSEETHYNDMFSNVNVPKRRPFFTVLFSTLTLILLAICIANTVYCWRKTRKYTLMGRSIDNEPDTPSASKIRYQDADTPLDSPLKRLISSWRSGGNGDTPPPYSGEDLWELNIWDPSKFNLYLACTFSPLHVVTILYGSFSFFTVIILLPLISVYLFALTFRFSTMVKDRSILHSEVLGEYGKKVVQPTIYTKKRDVAVGTDGTVDIYSPMPKSKYVTRDVRESRRPSLVPASVSSSPWMSPVRPPSTSSSSGSSSSNNLQQPKTTTTEPSSFNLRQRASMNSMRFQPAGYSTTNTPRTGRSRPWDSSSRRKTDMFNESPLARKN